jgi:molecular chaperone GrpE
MNEKTTKPKEEEEPKENELAEGPERLQQGLEKLRQELDKLGQELENARKEKDEVSDRLQRVYADYANFQKRVPKNIVDTVAYEKERFIRTFLPVLDNFDRTLREVRSAPNLDAVIRGVEIIRDQMLTILKSHGVEPIESVNEKFDPERHEAMLRRSEPDKENDIVLEEFQKGYALNGRVLRPSRVAINKVQPPAQPPEPEKEEVTQQGTEGDPKRDASRLGTQAPEAASTPDSSTE